VLETISVSLPIPVPSVVPPSVSEFPVAPVIQRTPRAVARYLRSHDPEDFEKIMELLRAGCHGLFLPRQPGERDGEGTKDFIEMWLVTKLQPLLDLSHAEILDWEKSGQGAYWSYQCKLALLQKLGRTREVIEVSLDDDETGFPLKGLLAGDGSMPSTGKITGTKLALEDVAKYCSDNIHAFQALGVMGDVLLAALEAFPDGEITASIAEAMSVSARQALRYKKRLRTRLQREIRKGNTVIRGLFSLLATGNDTLPEYRRQWNDGPCLMFSSSTPKKPGLDGGME
jgi:hypothetical protein